MGDFRMDFSHQNKRKKKMDNYKKQHSSLHEEKTADALSEPEPIQKRSRNRPAMMPPVFAPYNFVSLPKKTITLSRKDLPGHDKADSELLSGEINYEITAWTSIFIDDGSDHFYKNPEGCYTIPGSSIRGMIRSNAQILSLSSIEDDVDDYSLLYRDVANGNNKDRYNAVLGSKNVENGNKKNGKANTTTILTNVKAGYISNEGGKYVIYGTVSTPVNENFGDMNYYVLSERIAIEDVLNKENNKMQSGFSYLVNTIGKKWNRLQNKKEHFRDAHDKNGNHFYQGTPDPKYMPSYRPVSFSLTEHRRIGAVVEPGKTGNDWYSGWFLSSGAISKKKVVYIIPEIDRNKEIANLSEDYRQDLKNFQIDYNKRVNSLTLKKQHLERVKPNIIPNKIQEYKDFFNLPKEGQTKPVFYIHLNGRLYFGFTPRLRLYYDHTVKEGLGSNAIGERLDYAKAVFGYAYPENSYKSRVSFTDAVNRTQAMPEKDRYLTLSEPKPTDYYNYLVQSKRDISYNSKKFELRGVKQYWLHQTAEQGKTFKKANVKTDSLIRPLLPGTTFEGKIRFHNLKKTELGLVLWAIRLKPGTRMNIGQAKGFGYGSIEFTNLELRVFQPEKAYQLESALDLDPYQEEDIYKYIDIFKKDIEKYLDGRIDDQISIDELMNMKDGVNLPLQEVVENMTLKEFQKQKRKKIKLPSVKEVYNTGY